MNRFRARTLGNVEDLVHAEVGLRRRRGPDRISFIGFPDMERGTVHVRINGNRGNAHLAASAYHAHSDLSAVGNQNFLKHAFEWL